MQTLKLLVLFIALVAASCASKPAVTANSVKWMSLQEVATSLKQQKKPVLIDLYTDWCGWCKVMDQKTYANKNVSDYLSEKFYTIKVDAESRNALLWDGKSYAYNENYRTNDFAVYLTKGRLSYPTTIIIPANGEPQAIPGYLAPAEFELIAKYFGEGNFGKQSFNDFRAAFKSNW